MRPVGQILDRVKPQPVSSFDESRDEQIRQLLKPDPVSGVTQSGPAGPVTQSSVTQSEPGGSVTQSEPHGPSVTQDYSDTQILKETQETQDTQRKLTSSKNRASKSRTEKSPAPENEDGPKFENLAIETALWFSKHGSERFDQYLTHAYERFQEIREVSAQWRGLFDFIYLVSGHRDAQSLSSTPAKLFGVIELIFKRWSEKRFADGDSPPYGMTSDPWNDWLGVQRAEARAEFCDVISKLRYRPGQGPLHQARDNNRKCRVKLWAEIAARRPVDTVNTRSENDYEAFVGIACHLQLCMHDRPILIPVHHFAAIMGVSAMSITRYRNAAVADGFLVMVNRHRFREPGHRNRATEFRFAIEPFKELLAKRLKAGAVSSFQLLSTNFTPSE